MRIRTHIFVHLLVSIFFITPSYILHAVTEVDMRAEGAIRIESGAERTGVQSDSTITATTSLQEQQTTTKESEEKGGTTDINIGVGELNATQHNETDLNFAGTRAAHVSVSAVEVRGWDPQKKRAHLEAVKAHAEIRSDKELEQFAQGVLLKNEEVALVETSETDVRVIHRVPAKFLGVFTTTLEQEVVVRFGDGEHGRVAVRFPWTRFFYSVDSERDVPSVEQRLLPEIDDEVLVTADTMTPQVQASIIAKVVAVLKS